MPLQETESLAQRIQRIFVNHPHLQRRPVHFRTVGHDKVVLLGTVTSFFEKQLAQEAIRPLPGVREIENNLAVAKAGSP